jgi:O-antigen/teichoic acid export membrane protein
MLIVIQLVKTITRIQNSGFYNEVLKLVTGTTLAQIISVLAAPILARLYTPEEFGAAAAFAAFIGVLGVVVGLRYDLSITISKSPEEASNQLAISIILPLVSSIIFSLYLALFGRALFEIFRIEELAPYALLIPLGAFIAAVSYAFNFWLSKTGHYSTISISRVWQEIIGNTAKLGFAVGGLANAGALIIAGVLGPAASLIILINRFLKNDLHLFYSSITLTRLINGLKRYKKFPLFTTWSSLLNALSEQIPILLLTALFSPTISGYYAVGFRILRLPIILIGNSIAQVFYPQAVAELIKGNSYLSIFVERTFSQLVSLGLFPFLLLTVVGREVFVVVFGNGWSEAGVYVQLMSIPTFFLLISFPIGNLVSVLEKQEADVLYNILLLFAKIGSLIYGAYTNNIHLALLLLAISGSVVNLLFCVWLGNQSGVSHLFFIKELVSKSFKIAPILVIIIIAKYVLRFTDLYIVVLSGIVLFLYYFLLTWRKLPFFGVHE